MIGIGIVEDEALLREDLVHEMSSIKGFTHVFDFDSVESLLADLSSEQKEDCDVLLLDIELPGVSGVEALPKIKEALPDTEVIMLTSFNDQRTILKALCTGAVGYIAKGGSTQEIQDAINTVVNGGSYMSPEIAREIVQHLVGSTPQRKSSILTERQLEILNGLSEGHSYGEIGERLFISVETVRTHVKKMYRLLSVNNKTEAVALYLKGAV